MNITDISPDEFDDLLAIWEASVRATHHFLSEADVSLLKPMVRSEAFPNLVLKAVRNEKGLILGFVGVAENSVEALFVSPDSFGLGIGKALMQYAETELGTIKVDVNEQNPNALEFYKRIGYEIAGRSPVDGQGRPFPILHLQKAD